jgi:hypothetical protein
MAVVRRSPLDPYPVTPKYLATRSSALHIPPAQFSNMKFKSDEVYGVIVDMPMSPIIMVTMVCFINGAANLYFNNGAEYTGDYVEGCLWDNFIVSTRRGFAAIYENYLNEWSSDYYVEFQPGAAQTVFSNWYKFEEANA